jgi:CRP-like cAMP-binding protein
MENDDLITYALINGIAPVSRQSFSALFPLLAFSTIAKDQLFIRCGKPDNAEYFLLEGVCRSFLYDPQGEENTIAFFQGPTVLSPHLTRTNQGRSLLNFQAQTHLRVGSLPADEFLKLMIDNLEIRNFGNAVLRNELLRKVEKEIGLASLTAKERLQQLRQRYVMLENLIPHPQIASYLGITPISLSRLRGELAKEKQ